LISNLWLSTNYTLDCVRNTQIPADTAKGEDEGWQILKND